MTTEQQEPLQQVMVAVDSLRSLLSTVRNELDELRRDLRIGVFHSETTAHNWLLSEHKSRTISAALVTAFDEMGKIDTLIAPFLPAVVPPPPSPPGGDHDH